MRGESGNDGAFEVLDECRKWDEEGLLKGEECLSFKLKEGEELE